MVQTLTWAIHTIFIIVFMIGLIQRTSGWIGDGILQRKIYFPINWNACHWVYHNKPTFFNKGKEFLTQWPEKASVTGFLCLLIWPCLICLNLLLLAQVIELFFQGGKRITLMWVGTYSDIPPDHGFPFCHFSDPSRHTAWSQQEYVEQSRLHYCPWPDDICGGWSGRIPCMATFYR